jgi:hypothetical protein
MSSQPASTQNNNWVLLIAACAAGWFLSSYVNKGDSPKPDVVPVVSVEATTKQVLKDQAKGNADAFALAADKVDAKEIKTDRELLEFLKPATTKARLDANKPFDVLLETNLPDGSFEGKEAKISKLLRRIGASWK